MNQKPHGTEANFTPIQSEQVRNSLNRLGSYDPLTEQKQVSYAYAKLLYDTEITFFNEMDDNEAEVFLENVDEPMITATYETLKALHSEEEKLTTGEIEDAVRLFRLPLEKRIVSSGYVDLLQRSLSPILERRLVAYAYYGPESTQIERFTRLEDMFEILRDGDEENHKIVTDEFEENVRAEINRTGTRTINEQVDGDPTGQIEETVHISNITNEAIRSLREGDFRLAEAPPTDNIIGRAIVAIGKAFDRKSILISLNRKLRSIKTRLRRDTFRYQLNEEKVLESVQTEITKKMADIVLDLMEENIDDTNFDFIVEIRNSATSRGLATKEGINKHTEDRLRAGFNASLSKHLKLGTFPDRLYTEISQKGLIDEEVLRGYRYDILDALRKSKDNPNYKPDPYTIAHTLYSLFANRIINEDELREFGQDFGLRLPPTVE